jgi:hypothetical protein
LKQHWLVKWAGNKYNKKIIIYKIYVQAVFSSGAGLSPRSRAHHFWKKLHFFLLPFQPSQLAGISSIEEIGARSFL